MRGIERVSLSNAAIEDIIMNKQTNKEQNAPNFTRDAAYRHAYSRL